MNVLRHRGGDPESLAASLHYSSLLCFCSVASLCLWYYF